MDGAKRHAKIHGSDDHDTTVETTGHKTKHQSGGADEITVLGLKGQQIFVPFNAKIADITHADTNKHTLDLATALGETRQIIAVSVCSTRIAGTGYLRIYPNEGTYLMEMGSYYNTPRGYCVIANGTQRLQYSLSVVNDDYDMYCFGYVVEA